VSAPQFERLPRLTVVADAIAQIKQMIVDGRLQPGERLPAERSLADQLGLSRPTVREAIRGLVTMNILETRHGSGTYVSSLDLDDLLRPMQFVIGLSGGQTLGDLFEVRLMLEPEAARLAAQRATDEEISALVQCVEHGAECSREELLDHDVELHRLIAEACHNPLLVSMLGSISALGYESRAMTVQIPGVVERTLSEHASIVDAIAAGASDRAHAAMLEHVARVRDAALERTVDSGRGRE
jgi:GntR family transcriptional repressor for pyruvate dehydrogenase complex